MVAGIASHMQIETPLKSGVHLMLSAWFYIYQYYKEMIL